MDAMNPQKAKQLLSQIQTIKAFATSVEADLQSYLGGVGTAQERQPKKGKIDIEAIRIKARKQFSKK